MLLRTTRNHRWAIVLAAGAGTRLRALARDVAGQPIPKQYWSPDGGNCLLRRSLARADRLVPRERIVVVVAADHEVHWRDELEDRLPAENIIVQPRNRGTAAGILLPLAVILRRDARARVVILPSDHGVTNEWALSSALERAFRAVERAPERLVLLGMALPRVADGLGWIVPGSAIDPRDDGPQPIRRFVEKPGHVAAHRLWRQGALASSFLIAADGAVLRRLFDEHLPRLSCGFRRLRPDRSGFEYGALIRLYETLPNHDFSTEILVPAVNSWDLIRVPPCGWTDLGTPERVRAWTNEASQHGSNGGPCLLWPDVNATPCESITNPSHGLVRRRRIHAESQTI